MPTETLVANQTLPPVKEGLTGWTCCLVLCGSRGSTNPPDPTYARQVVPYCTVLGVYILAVALVVVLVFGFTLPPLSTFTPTPGSLQHLGWYLHLELELVVVFIHLVIALPFILCISCGILVVKLFIILLLVGFHADMSHSL